MAANIRAKTVICIIVKACYIYAEQQRKMVTDVFLLV